MPASALLVINLFPNDEFVYNYYNPTDHSAVLNYNPDPNGDPNKPNPNPSEIVPEPGFPNKNAIIAYYFNKTTNVDYFDPVAFPDSYFTMESVECEYNMPIDDEITGSITNSVISACFPKYDTVETGSDVIAAARVIINDETDVLNSSISYAMNLAQSTVGTKKQIPTDAVYGVATSAKLIISGATNSFNNNTASAKQQLNAAISAAAANPTTQLEYKVIDPKLLQLYARVIRFLENGIGKGKSPETIINPLTNKRTGVTGEFKNRAYKDSQRVWTIGIGHNINDTYPLLYYSGESINVGPDGPGISDELVETIFLDDLVVKIKEVQNYIGVKKWNYLHDNDQCMLILLIDIQYNTSGIQNSKWAPLLYGNGFSSGIGSGLGLNSSRSFNQIINLSSGKYNLNLWSTNNSTTALNYKIQKQKELSDIMTNVRPLAGQQRNYAIQQLFIDKNKYGMFTITPKKASPYVINYWTKLNTGNLDLSSYVHTK